MPFKSLIKEFSEDSEINNLIQRMLAYIKTQTENPKFPESGFPIDKIMHLYINFHKLELARGGSYTELLEWLKSKKAVINLQNKDEECFKWSIIEALHHKDIKYHPERISLLRSFEKRYNLKGLEFPVLIQKIDKFEKNNPGKAVNVLFKKQANLLMIVDGEKRHYTAIKNISKFFSKLNGKTRCAYHFCMNCLNGFGTSSARDKHHEYCSSSGQVKIKMSTEKEKWFKFNFGQYQFKVPFMLYADFESILKPVDERYRDRMNTMKAEGKGKASYMEKIHVTPGWYVHSTFAYRDVPDPLKMYQGKECVKKFVEYIEEEVKWLYETFTRQHVTKLTDAMNREHKAADHCHYTVYIEEQSTIMATLNIEYQTTSPLCFTT